MGFDDEDEYYDIYGGEDEYLADESDLDESYETIYDEDGYNVYCDRCRAEMKWHNGAYLCPHCGQIMSRAEFFNYIGANPPGKECVTCDNLYPGCTVCLYGYVKDDEY